MSNLSLKRPFLERIFRLKENSTCVKTEFFAGLTTFSTMAYALLLVPSLLGEAGMNFGAAMTATLLTGAFATLLMGFIANYPFALAPGVALCAYFTYSVVQGKGYSWQTALGVIFVCGLVFVLLNFLRIRALVISAVPASIRTAVTAGLGLFLAFIGLKNAGIIVSHPSTLVTFGDPTSPSVVLTLVGLIFVAILMVFRVRGGIFIGIVATWLLSLCLGIVEFEGLMAWPSSLSPTLFQLDIRSVFNKDLINIVISFLFVSLFDTSGTLVGLAEEGGFLKSSEKKHFDFPRLSRALVPDTTGSLLASFLGTSASAVYLESAAGISCGGRTGLTSIVVGILFLITLFFTPFASSIPLFATAPALILIGGLMLRQIGKLNWEDPSEWIPGFVTMILIPLTSSVAMGVAGGFIIYPIVKALTGKAKEVHWFCWLLCGLFVLKCIFIPN